MKAFSSSLVTLQLVRTGLTLQVASTLPEAPTRKHVEVG